MKLEKGLCQYATFEKATCQFFDILEWMGFAGAAAFCTGVFFLKGIYLKTWRICFDSFFDPLVKIERKKKLHPPPLSKKVAYCTSLLFDGIP